MRGYKKCKKSVPKSVPKNPPPPAPVREPCCSPPSPRSARWEATHRSAGCCSGPEASEEKKPEASEEIKPGSTPVHCSVPDFPIT